MKKNKTESTDCQENEIYIGDFPIADYEQTRANSPHLFSSLHQPAPARRRGNPNKTPIAKIVEALKIEEKSRGISVWRHLARRAYDDDSVLLGLMKKLVPDQLAQTVRGAVIEVRIEADGTAFLANDNNDNNEEKNGNKTKRRD